MRGKYITTNLKLAVKSDRKNQVIDVKETTASLSQHHTIWSKMENNKPVPVSAEMPLKEMEAA